MMVVASRQISTELDWYFQESAAAMGLSSSFWPMVQVAMFGGGSRDLSDGATEDLMISRITATSRHRRVHKALMTIPGSHQETLAAAYGDRELPAILRERFGRAAGVALLSNVAKAAFREDAGAKRIRNESTMVAWLASIASYGESEILLNAIRTEANERLARAYRSFELAWNRHK